MVDNPAPQPENPPNPTPDMPPPPPPTPEAPVTPTPPVKPSTPSTPPPSNPRIKEAKPYNWPVIILSLLLLVAIGFAATFGYLYYQLSQEPPIVTQPSPTPTATTPTPTPDLTANWEFYSNNEIKVSFKYPQINQNDVPLEIYISPLNLTHLSLREVENTGLFLDVVLLENTELEDWYQKTYSATKQEQPNPPTLTTGPLISGIQSTQSTFNITGYGEAIHIFVPAGNNLYQIMIPNNNNDLQNQILSTLQFIE